MNQMKKLLRLLYDLEPKKSLLADILLFPRKDTKSREIYCFEYLRDKFDLEYGSSNKSVSGWPHGPNAMAMDVFRQVHTAHKAGLFKYKAALLMESDCVPLRPTWLQELHNEWDSQSGLALGHWDGSGKTIKAPTSHMNGNMIFSPELVSRVPDLAKGVPMRGGWDMVFWPQIAPYATPSRLIFNDYRLNTSRNPLKSSDQIFGPKFHTYPDNPLHGQELHPCWLHGCKGTRAIEMVREKFL